MTVEEMLDRMGASEFDDWMAYYTLEPWGEERADIRQALTTTAIVNFAEAHSKRPKWRKPEDFMPFRDPEPKRDEPLTADEAMAKFDALLGVG